MSGVLERLEPQKVFYYFEELSKIPRCSFHEKKVSDYVLNWAQERGLEVIQDQALNILIRKSGSPGYENAPTVILQGHLDMVCEKNSDTVHDFANDPLKLRVCGDAIYATGTTLGADNGIAVAYTMAILDLPDLPHPPLEVILTTDEEAGMTGVQALDPRLIRGRILINMDSEEEGVFYAGCAGGGRVEFAIPVVRQAPRFKQFYRLAVKGLKGGHSGTDIDKERGNAIQLLGRMLYDLKDNSELVEVSGGSKANAIPREAQAVLAINDNVQLPDMVTAWKRIFRHEYLLSDTEVEIIAEPAEASATVIDRAAQHHLVQLINLVPGGPMRRDPEHGRVVYSNNLGVLASDDSKITLTCSPRSSVKSLLNQFVSIATQVAEALNIKVNVSSFYPGWEYSPDSKIRDLCLQTYEELYQKKGRVDVVHAGLECGYLMEKIPELDAISLGPDVADGHSPNEHLSITSTARMFKFLCEILKRIR